MPKEDRTDRPRPGSSASRKQIAFAVRDERMVTAHLATGNDVAGYVCQADDYHWIIVRPETMATVLIHKSAPSLEVHPSRQIEQEPEPDAIRKVTDPFRDYVLRTEFSMTPSSKEQSA